MTDVNKQLDEILLANSAQARMAELLDRIDPTKLKGLVILELGEVGAPTLHHSCTLQRTILELSISLQVALNEQLGVADYTVDLTEEEK